MHCLEGWCPYLRLRMKGQIEYPPLCCPCIYDLGDHPVSDIWWRSLGTCSNLFSWRTPYTEQHQVVCILLENSFVIQLILSERKQPNIVYWDAVDSVSVLFVLNMNSRCDNKNPIAETITDGTNWSMDSSPSLLLTWKGDVFKRVSLFRNGDPI